MERNSGQQDVGDHGPTSRHLKLIRFESRAGGFVPEDKGFETTENETPTNPEALDTVTYEMAPNGDLTVTFEDAAS